MDHNQIISHFLQLNRTRIARLSKLVTSSQQRFFNLLPFLIHTNIPGLPGYINKDVPVGIIDYQADEKTIKDAEKLNPALRYRHHAIRHYAVAGLYLINPYGLLNIPKQLSFTLYLVYTDLTETQRQVLEKKLTLLRRWAKDCDIDLNITFFAQHDLKTTSLSPEQREQLYLNGLNLGGAIPLWCLVPPNEDYQTIAASLSQQRLSTSRLLLDFGPSNVESPQTLLEDTTALLNEGLEYGLTQILSLLYKQSQITHYPNQIILSDEVKKAIYEGENEPLALDCKVLQLRHIERINDNPTNTRLARQSLYIQTQEALSKHTSLPQFPWRRDYIKQLSNNWSWSSYEFQVLDRRESAKYPQCQDEHLQTHAIFANTSTVLHQFAKQEQLTIQSQHKQIDKKLQNYQDPPPNIISRLPKGLVAKTPEDEIHLYHFNAEDDWKLSLIALSAPKQRPLYQSPSLLHLLAWAVHNGLLTKSTRILIADKTHSITINTLISLVQQLCRSPLATQAELDSKVLSKPAKLDQLMLFANLAQSTGDTLKQRSTQISSRHNDPFNYADRGESLLYRIDGLLCSTWGEWRTFHHEGSTAPLLMFESLIPWWLAGRTKTVPSCWCHAEAHGQLICSRLQTLYKEVNTHYIKNKAGNYIMLIADDLYQLHWQPSGFDVTAFIKADLNAALGNKKAHFSMTKVDAALDPTAFYQQLLSCQHQDFTNLIIQTQNQTTSIHIIDNNGNVFSQHKMRLTPVTALTHYHRFLSIIQPSTIRCFEIEQRHSQQWQLVPIPQPQISTKQGYLPVIVTMENTSINAPCIIHCGPEKFFGTANDPSLFEQVSSFIIQLRKHHQQYPLYINEIRFPLGQKISTAEYILQKQRLEKLLNHD